jgi:hypothetical protein
LPGGSRGLGDVYKRQGISPRTLRYKLAQLREHGLGMASAAC